jgi:hypothetical protein
MSEFLSSRPRDFEEATPCEVWSLRWKALLPFEASLRELLASGCHAPKRNEMGNEKLDTRASVIGRQEDLHLQPLLQLLLLLEIPTTLKSLT